MVHKQVLGTGRGDKALVFLAALCTERSGVLLRRDLLAVGAG